ncbi:hypothetical protein [Streptomyces sp. NPDC097619]|uniref:hypothetical protein n=1 Tax=Streptomyces sp. NPDC097619 TaxID=3157228 RepID=UPI00332FED23
MSTELHDHKRRARRAANGACVECGEEVRSAPPHAMCPPCGLRKALAVSGA